MQESDLYPPLKNFLEAQGYQVKGEIGDCDVVALRNDQSPVVVELKCSLNLTVLMQATERLAVTDQVYIGIPRSSSILRTRKNQLLKLLRMVGIGLLGIELVGDKGYVEVMLDPSDYKPRQNNKRKERLLGEFRQRRGDPNLGGASRKKGLMTAYRQRALAIAEFLNVQGPSKASLVASHLSETKARDIMYRNVYGWFYAQGKGIYSLSAKGEIALQPDTSDVGENGEVRENG